MRRIVIAIILAFLSLQVASQKISLGIQAGLSLANMHESYWDKSKQGDTKPGIIVGVTGHIPIKSNSFQPAINFVQKGFKKEESGSGYVFSDEITLSYIEVPLNFLYHHRLSGLQIFAGAGPSVAFAISGQEKTNEYGNMASYTFHFGNDVDKDDLRLVEYGANFLAGVAWRNIFLNVNYNLGLSSLIPGGNENGTLKNNYLGVRLGYLFAPISKTNHSN